MRTFVFIDLDGTFWEHERIPASALAAVKTARENGHMVFVNTGRARSTAENVLGNLDLDGFVYSAGTEIVMHGERIFFHPMELDKLRRIMDAFDERNVAYCLEGSTGTFVTPAYAEHIRQNSAFNRVSDTFKNLPQIKDMTEEDFETVMKISVKLNPDQNIDDIMEEEHLVFTPFGFQMEGVRAGELTEAGYSKGTAMNVVRELVDPTARTMAIGDSENDIPILVDADFSVCMGNGTEAAKKAAKWITDTFANDGFAKAFEKAGLLEEDHSLLHEKHHDMRHAQSAL